MEEYVDDLTFEEVLTYTLQNSKNILVWQPFKNYSTSIANYLTSHKVFGFDKFVFVQGPVPYLPNDVAQPEHEPALGHTNWFSKRATNYTKVLPIRKYPGIRTS